MLVNILHTLQTSQRNGNPLISDIALFTLDGIHTHINPRPYLNSIRMFPHVAELIANAQHEVLITLFKFHNDSNGGQEIIRALTRLSESGRPVRINIMLEHSSGVAAQFIKSSKQSPLDLNLIHSLNTAQCRIIVTHHKHSGTASTHAKYIVVDGSCAFILTGDPSLKNMYTNDAWIEAGTEVHGPIVTSIRNHFVRNWNSERVQPAYERDRKEPLVLQEVLPCTYEEGQNGLMFLGKAASNNLFKQNLGPYKIAFLMLMQNARFNVRLMVNNINDIDVLMSLAECAMRGVKVSILIGRYMTEKSEALPYAGGTNLSSMRQLLRLTNPTFHHNLDIRWACHNGQLVQNGAPGTVHCKLTIIDEEYFLTGSSLQDAQSLYGSRESDLLIRSKHHAQIYLNDIFLRYFHCARVMEGEDKFLRETDDNISRKLIAVRSLQDLLPILQDYIATREYEEDSIFKEKVKSLFQGKKSQDKSRSNKIAAALKLKNFLTGETKDFTLNSAERHSFQDGRLGEIYKKFCSLH